MVEFQCESLEEKYALLSLVQQAIKAILVGAQSYRIGSHEMTRADLSKLMSLRATLQREIAEEEAGSAMQAHARVPYFDRR